MTLLNDNLSDIDPYLKNINFDDKSKELGISKDIYLRILTKVISQTVQDIINLEQAISKTDYSVIQTISHRLKGDYGNLRIEPSAALAVEINQMAKTGTQIDTIKIRFNRFKASFSQLKKIIENQSK